MKRLWISSMEDSAIKEGFDNLKDGSFYEFVLFVIGLLTVDRFICYLRNMITKL